MKRVKSEGLIYKLISYSDKSAIAFAFAKDFGTIKLFITRAFGKKGGTFKFLPGSIDFLYKENSDLHKFYGFEQNIKYYYFLENPFILIRLNIIFAILHEFGLEQELNEKFWKLILNIKENNIYKSFVYISYFLIQNSGFLPELQCYSCGNQKKLYVTHDGSIFCKNCYNEEGFQISDNLLDILKKLQDPQLFKKKQISQTEEKLFANFINFLLNKIHEKRIKAFDMLYI